MYDSKLPVNRPMQACVCHASCIISSLPQPEYGVSLHIYRVMTSYWWLRLDFVHRVINCTQVPDTQEVFIDTAGEGSLTLERQEGSDEAVMQLLRSVSDQAT